MSDLPFAPPRTVGDVIALYLTHTKDSQNERTFEGRQHALSEFSRTHGELPLTEAKSYHLQLWIDARSQRWRSEWTRRRAASTVQVCFNWAMKLGIIDQNPFRGVRLPPGQRGEPMEPWEFQAMLRATSAPFRWRLKDIRSRAEVRPETTLYGLRHLLITEAVLSGVDIATVAALAGHERITTTQHYLHVAGRTDHLRAAVQSIQRGTVSKKGDQP